MKIPRLMVSAAASGSGKTLITCGILQVLKDRGLTPASFKCGPDYIDPMFHSRVLGTKSRNLDTFFASDETVRYLLSENAKDCDISVLEGVMGYYDGLAGIDTKASAYDVADVTQTPVVFLVNCRGMSLSVLPYIQGFLNYKTPSYIKGVILNQISPMLYPRVKQMIEEALPVQVLGYVPVLKECVLESRHLGLVMPDEIKDIQEKLKELAKVLEKTLDVDGLISLAKDAPEIRPEEPKLPRMVKEAVRVAVARDAAFCFLYEDNLRLLEKLGANVVEFSPLEEEKLPEADGLLLPGGYPELYAKRLNENASMRRSIREAIKQGMPCMAECGGFMYLHEQMEDMEGKTYEMAGVIQGKAYYTGKLGRFGYITLQEGSIFGKEAGAVPAHEFHYFDSENCGEAFDAEKPKSSRSWKCMHSTDTILAGFPHLYYYGYPRTAAAFLEKCLERKRLR